LAIWNFNCNFVLAFPLEARNSASFTLPNILKIVRKISSHEMLRAISNEFSILSFGKYMKFVHLVRADVRTYLSCLRHAIQLRESSIFLETGWFSEIASDRSTRQVNRQ